MHGMTVKKKRQHNFSWMVTY